MGNVNKWCPICGATPGNPCTIISGVPKDLSATKAAGLRAGDPRPEPHFSRYNDRPIGVAIKDEPGEWTS